MTFDDPLASRRRRILLVEDNPDHVLLVRAAFAKVDPSTIIEVVSMGEEALGRLESEAYDAILMDCHLPDRDGLELLRQVAAKDDRLPVVVVTGQGDEELAAQAMREGASDYIVKSPDYPMNVALAVDRALDKHRLMLHRQELEQQVRKRNKELTVLNAVGAALSRSIRLDDILGGALDTVLDALEFEAGAIYLVDQKSDELVLKAARDLPAGVSEQLQNVGFDAIRSGEGGTTQLIDDADDKLKPAWDEARKGGFKALVRAPLRSKATTIGIMVLGTFAERRFTDSGLQLLDTIGDQMAVAVENARLVAEVQQRLADLDRLYRVGADMVGTLDLDQVLLSIVETAQEVIPAAGKAMIHLLDEESQLLIPRVPSDPEADPLVKARMVVGKGIAGLVSQEGRSAYVPDTTKDPRYLDLGSDIRSLLVVPLLIGDEAIGTLSVDSPQVDAFDRENERMLTMLASQAAIAITNARLHQQIKRSEERYRSMVENSSDAICLVDLDDWRFLEVNPQTEKLSGYSGEELMGMTADDVHWVQDGDGGEKTFRELLSSPKRDFEDLLFVRKNGDLVPISARINPIPDSERRLAQVILRDVSARKKMEQQLIHNEKLAALGRLAASLAHEINNPLQAIRSSISLLANRPLDEEKSNLYLGIAETEVGRLIEMVQRMLDFYRPYKERRDLTDVNALLEDTLALASKQLQHGGIKTRKELTPDLPPVEAIANYLKQVFINIVLNAVEAMPDGGELAVRTSVDHEDHEVLIAFSDTGVTIPPEDLPYIFEPFYTTKDKGTGLGLAISYSIVEQHEGTIEVSSTQGKGTTFVVRLPLTGERSG